MEGSTTGLYKQDLSTLDVSKLTALSREVISRQATINIGTIGHVAHGKSTVVKAISGVQTVRFKNELERNITIKLGEEDSVEGVGEGDSPCTSTTTQTTCKINGRVKRKSVPREYRQKKPPKKKKKVSDGMEKSAPGKQPGGEWEVEKILDFDNIDGEKKFLIKWKGWSSEYNSWEPTKNVSSCQDLIINFFRHNQSAALEAKIRGEPTSTELKERALELVPVDQEILVSFMKSIRVDGKLQFKQPTKEELEHMLRKSINNIMTDTEIEEVKRAILSYRLHLQRKQQLLNLKDWENELNALASHEAKIVVENDYDLEVAPPNFSFVASYIPGHSVQLPENPPIGCSCAVCGPKSSCCNAQNEAKFPYKAGKLIVPLGTPIFECNSCCKCGDDCPNRVVQKGRKVKLSIFRTPNGIGWGVKAMQLIKKGTFVCQYVGELILCEEAESREQIYDAEGRTYLFDLDFNDPDNCLYTVDATTYGNISHFVNHSCDPNCGIFAVWINCLDINIPNLALFALRDIQVQEEVTFNYTSQLNSKAQSQSFSQSRLSRSLMQDLNESSSSNVRIECRCGAQKCRKYLF